MNSNLLVRPPLTVLHLPEISPPSITVFKYQSLCVLVAPSCPTLCDPLDCSLPGSSVNRILQTGILEWVLQPLPVHESATPFYSLGQRTVLMNENLCLLQVNMEVNTDGEKLPSVPLLYPRPQIVALDAVKTSE